MSAANSWSCLRRRSAACSGRAPAVLSRLGPRRGSSRGSAERSRTTGRMRAVSDEAPCYLGHTPLGQRQVPTGMAWAALPHELGSGSGMSGWRYRLAWQPARVWQHATRGLWSRGTGPKRSRGHGQRWTLPPALMNGGALTASMLGTFPSGDDPTRIRQEVGHNGRPQTARMHVAECVACIPVSGPRQRGGGAPDSLSRHSLGHAHPRDPRPAIRRLSIGVSPGDRHLHQARGTTA
jgi:hypothetical protein